MIRISATKLESYRRWLENEDSSLDDIVNYLLNKIEPTEAMLAGSAFHKVIENVSSGKELDVVNQDGFTFDFTHIDYELALPTVKEVKLENRTTINGEQVTFVGVVDALSISEVFDHKLTSQPNVENYIDSIQWRCYLDWFDCNKFTYNLFQGYKTANKDCYLIKSFLPVSFYRYKGMRADIENISVQFIDFVKCYVPELITKE